MLERRVGETLHIANDFVRCLSHCVGEIFQNLFYAQNQFVDITYIQNLSTFFKYYNILKRKKALYIYKHVKSFHLIYYLTTILTNFLGTATTLTIDFPSTNAFIFSSSIATFSISSLDILAATLNFPLTFPFI